MSWPQAEDRRAYLLYRESCSAFASRDLVEALSIARAMLGYGEARNDPRTCAVALCTGAIYMRMLGRIESSQVDALLGLAIMEAFGVERGNFACRMAAFVGVADMPLGPLVDDARRRFACEPAP